MTRSRSDLKLVGGSRARRVPEPRCSVAAQAVMAGEQDMWVTAVTAEVSGRGYGHLCIRVGRTLTYLEDRAALRSWQRALQQAEELADAAFGPDMPPPAYRPRGS